ncbi:MAG: hypothetical protein QM778_28505 [Myxococcales bacterium]
MSRAQGTPSGQAAAPAPASIDLRPRAIALAADEEPSDRATSDASSGKGRSASGDAEGELSERVPGLVRASDATLEQQLTRAARELIFSVIQAWRGPFLVGDVRYWYIGRGFDAAIAKDGRVFIQDRDGFVVTPVSAMSAVDKGGGGGGTIPGAVDRDADGSQRVGGKAAVGVGVGFSDPGATLMRAAVGEDRYATERRTFLEASAPLRAHLEEQASKEKQRQVDARVTSTMERMWKKGAERTRSVRETLEFWQSLADDASGDAARVLVLEFFERWKALHGQCPFTRDELPRLSTQTGKHPFKPCESPREDVRRNRTQ